MNISDAAFQIEARIALPEDEVHLWQVNLAVVAKAEQRWEGILSADERVRAARFHFAQDRQYFTATRALLRMILGSYVDSDPKKLVFRYSEKEKPSLAPSQSVSRLEFNVSHSGEIALLAFTRGRLLGVDVEQLREDFDHAAIARRFFSEQERRQLAELAPSERFHGFFRCWTRKEAYIKAQGTGLSLPLHQFDVSLRTGDENALLATRPDTTEAAQWSLREVPVRDGYIAALCVRGQGWHLKT
jgi:4'-phosphopantetheinyl transferase